MSKYEIEKKGQIDLYNVKKKSNLGAWIGWGIVIFIIIAVISGS